jgi:hypothetical protein
VISDRSMQLNEAMFLQNGKCGYILKPSYLRKFSHEYNPSSFYSLADGYLVSFVVTVCDTFMHECEGQHAALSFLL